MERPWHGLGRGGGCDGRVLARECLLQHHPRTVLTLRLMKLPGEIWGDTSLISGCSEPHNMHPEVCLSPNSAFPPPPRLSWEVKLGARVHLDTRCTLVFALKPCCSQRWLGWVSLGSRGSNQAGAPRWVTLSDRLSYRPLPLPGTALLHLPPLRRCQVSLQGS